MVLVDVESYELLEIKIDSHAMFDSFEHIT